MGAIHQLIRYADSLLTVISPPRPLVDSLNDSLGLYFSIEFDDRTMLHQRADGFRFTSLICRWWKEMTVLGQMCRGIDGQSIARVKINGSATNERDGWTRRGTGERVGLRYNEVHHSEKGA